MIDNSLHSRGCDALLHIYDSFFGGYALVLLKRWLFLNVEATVVHRITPHSVLCP